MSASKDLQQAYERRDAARQRRVADWDRPKSWFARTILHATIWNVIREVVRVIFRGFR